MNCPRTEDLSALIDHALPAHAQVALQQHLHACPLCSQHLAALQTQRQQLLALRDAGVAILLVSTIFRLVTAQNGKSRK